MFSLPKLPYPYDALEPYIDEKTMRIHHDKHHAGYVKKLNAALQNHKRFANTNVETLLIKLNSIPARMKTAIRNNGGGHANHSLFWKVMSPAPNATKERKAKGSLSEAIDNNFGSFEQFKQKFSQVAASRFGSGWAWLVVDKKKLSITSTTNQNTPLSKGKIPILCLDVWEHAYYLKYQNRRAEYIENWWNVVNWKKVQANFIKTIK